MMPVNSDPFKKIMDRSEWVNGCLEWTGGTNTDGYGYISVNYKELRVHRVVYEYYNGPIPKGYVPDHTCKNRKCVFYKHLELVTNKENVLRGEGPSAINKRKTYCIKGHPYDEQNTVYTKRGRACRTCRRLWAMNGPDYLYS